MNDTKYISTTELEERLQRKIRSIRRLIEKNGFPPPVISGNGIENLWLRSQVEAWEDAQVAKAGWTPPTQAEA